MDQTPLWLARTKLRPPRPRADLLGRPAGDLRPPVAPLVNDLLEHLPGPAALVLDDLHAMPLSAVGGRRPLEQQHLRLAGQADHRHAGQGAEEQGPVGLHRHPPEVEAALAGQQPAHDVALAVGGQQGELVGPQGRPAPSTPPGVARSAARTRPAASAMGRVSGPRGRTAAEIGQLRGEKPQWGEFC